MLKRLQLALISIVLLLTLAACGGDGELNTETDIGFIPNEDYVGDPHPKPEIKMKLTDEEREEFEQIQKEVLSNKEGE